MTTSISPVITTAGQSAAVAADGMGLALHLTHIALGSASYNPIGTETSLVDRREYAAISSGVKVGNQVTMSATIRTSGYIGGAYNIGEVGFYAGDPEAGGTLFAVASQVGQDFGRRGSGSVAFVVTFVLTITGVPSGSVTVTVDPEASAAHYLLQQHVDAGDPHHQYVLKSGGTMTGPLVLAGNAVSALQSVPKQQLDAAIAALVLTPPGAILAFAGAAVPSGWLECNGSLVSRSIYASLFYVIGTTYGAGDGLTTFNVPDLRGEFVRGWDHGRGADSGRSLGSSQTDAMQNIVGYLRYRSVDAVGGAAEFSASGPFAPDGPMTYEFGADLKGSQSHSWSFDASRVARTSSETRGRNVALMYCIKT